jgi:hypothetical protein
MSSRSYTFIILRYRHDPVAGELLNVGVVVHAPGARFLGARFRKSLARFHKVYPDLSTPALRDDINRLSKSFAAASKSERNELFFDKTSAETYARRIVDQSSAFVWSTMGSGVTDSPQAALDDVYDRFVARFEEKHEERRTDQDIWRPFRDRLAEHHVTAELQAKIIRSPVAEVEFDHAWKNGEWHCLQPLSFDLASPDGIQDKAARWAGNFVGLAESPEPFRAYLIVGAPSDPALQTAYGKALSLIRQAPAPPVIIEEDEASAFADQFAAQIAAHSS